MYAIRSYYAIKQDALFNYALISFELGSDPFNETILAFEESYNFV